MKIIFGLVVSLGRIPALASFYNVACLLSVSDLLSALMANSAAPEKIFKNKFLNQSKNLLT
jgi:hypothetical protein